MPNENLPDLEMISKRGEIPYSSFLRKQESRAAVAVRLSNKQRRTVARPYPPKVCPKSLPLTLSGAGIQNLGKHHVAFQKNQCVLR